MTVLVPEHRLPVYRVLVLVAGLLAVTTRPETNA